MRSLTELTELKDKKVFVRVDWNGTLRDGQVAEDFRVQQSLPTLKYLSEKGARLIIATHYEPAETSLEPLLKYIPEGAELLPNLRLNSGEESNDEIFAKSLAEKAEIYVNEAFSVSHRKHASIVGVPKFLPSYAGLQLEKEVKNLSSALSGDKHPFLFILGGAKFSTKMPLIEKYLGLADHVFIGGALLNDFLKAKGYEVGTSLVDSTSVGFEKILENPKLILPEHILVESDGKISEKSVSDIKSDEYILDIGEESVKKLEILIKEAKLILWNGPLGKYETGGGGATKKLLEMVAASDAESIVGGGDTVAVITENKMEDKFTFISTGGGATLDFLANGILPGIKALQ